MPVDVGVVAEELVRVPERDDHLSKCRHDALLVGDEVLAAQHRAAEQEPAHGVGSVVGEHLLGVRIVAQPLAHLLPVVAEDDPVNNAVAERRLIEQDGGQHVQVVEPRARLTHVLDDEIGGEMGEEPLFLLEGIVHLRVRHRAGLEPAVEHLLDATHGGPPARVVRVGTGETIDVGTVKVGRTHAEVTLDVVERAVDIDAREGGVVALPHRDG